MSGETEMDDEFDTYSNTIWIDMPMFSRVMHVLKQVLKFCKGLGDFLLIFVL